MARSDGHPRAALIVAGARVLLGRPFRPQGRTVAGLDCLGLVLAAARSGGIGIAGYGDIPLRGLTIEEACAMLEHAGCRRLAALEARPGDILLQAPAALQIHVALVTMIGIVEAHAGLKRVVERPVAAEERWHSAWRLPMGEE